MYLRPSLLTSKDFDAEVQLPGKVAILDPQARGECGRGVKLCVVVCNACGCGLAYLLFFEAPRFNLKVDGPSSTLPSS